MERQRVFHADFHQRRDNRSDNLAINQRFAMLRIHVKQFHIILSDNPRIIDNMLIFVMDDNKLIRHLSVQVLDEQTPEFRRKLFCG